MAYTDLLRQLTVNCKDNGRAFIVDERIRTIRSLLADSSYQLWREGGLSFVYAKPGFFSSEYKVLISTHIDCVYQHCFVEDTDEAYLKGTFDNSATNAAVIDLMLRDELDDSVMIAFTGDEEINSQGAVEVMHFLQQSEHRIDRAIVLDVTNEGWADEAVFSVENDRGFDILSGYQIVNALQASQLPCVFLHDAEPDETWEYGKGIPGTYPGIPCFSLCMPVDGDMHSDAGVYLRPSSIEGYLDILKALANARL